MDSVLITLTTAGASTGPFDLYSDVDGYISAFETGVAKVDLVAGYLSTVVPTGTAIVRVLSTGTCTNYVDLPVSGITTTTTTTSTTSTSTTTGPTLVSLDINGKTSSGSNRYMWWSADSGTNWTMLSPVLTTSCSVLGSTSFYPLGTTFLVRMSDIDGPNTTVGYGTNLSTGGSCPGVVTNCSSDSVTPVTAGTLTVWVTGNLAYNAC